MIQGLKFLFFIVALGCAGNASGQHEIDHYGELEDEVKGIGQPYKITKYFKVYDETKRKYVKLFDKSYKVNEKGRIVEHVHYGQNYSQKENQNKRRLLKEIITHDNEDRITSITKVYPNKKIFMSNTSSEIHRNQQKMKKLKWTKKIFTTMFQYDSSVVNAELLVFYHKDIDTMKMTFQTIYEFDELDRLKKRYGDPQLEVTNIDSFIYVQDTMYFYNYNFKLNEEGERIEISRSLMKKKVYYPKRDKYVTIQSLYTNHSMILNEAGFPVCYYYKYNHHTSKVYYDSQGLPTSQTYYDEYGEVTYESFYEYTFYPLDNKDYNKPLSDG